MSTVPSPGHETDYVPRNFSLLGLAVAVGLCVVLTAVMRFPSAEESFWIDELHSAWTVQDSFGEVAWRASVGNQTTGYFHLLWFWRQLVGDGEIALRSISILASAVTVGFLVVGVAWQTRRWEGGLVAGGIVAVDPNAVFFGVELRPYALVMVCGALAAWSMMVWLSDPLVQERGSNQSVGTRRLRRSHSGARWRLSMLFWICVAALIHPTSLGVLGWFLPVSTMAAWYRGRLRFWKADAVAAVVLVATMVSLAMSSLPDSWAVRDRWRAFGQATDIQQLWYAWDWIPLVIIPLGAALLIAVAYRLLLFRQRNQQPPSGPTPVEWLGWLPGLIGVLGTVTFFIASYYQWVPLWHRRYFIAALPLLAWGGGAAASLMASRVYEAVRVVFCPTRRRLVEAVIAGTTSIALLGGQLYYQQTLARFRAGEIPVQLRGEPWRELVKVLNQQKNAGDPVWLSTGLIEADIFDRPVSESMDLGSDEWAYLAFPLSGPYQANPVTVVECGEHPSWLRQHASMLPERPTTVWLVSRGHPASSRSFVESLKRLQPMNATRVMMGHSLSLTRLDFRAD